MASLGRLDRRTRSKSSKSPLPSTRSSSRGINQIQRKDAAEVLAIEAYIEDELRRLKYHPETTQRDRYIIHKNAFDQVVEQAVVYKPVLSTVKAEFEECIAALEKGQSQAIYLQGMVKALMVEKSTLTQFERRGDELEEKLEKLRTFNLSLKMKLQALRDERGRRLASARTKSMRSVHKRVQHTIPGLTVEELTDIPTLHRTLRRLELQVSELASASETQFVEKERKSILKNEIKKKEEVLIDVAELNKRLQQRCEVMKVVVEATKKALDNPDQDIHITNVVTKALADFGMTKYGRAGSTLQQFISFDDDDPIKKKEAERIIEYCEHFNNLFDFGQYDAAAIHAANSPFGILRNYETLIRFKQADPIEDGRKPLLIFCDALMETACSAQPLTQAMSMECIKCALMEDRLDLATHWLAQGKLSYSIPLGEVLAEHCKCTDKCTCACTLLAQTVFTKVNAHQRAAKCISKQEKYVTLLHYTKKYGNFKKTDYKNLLTTASSPELARLMLTTKHHKHGAPVLSLASVTSVLLEAKKKDTLVQMFKKLSSENKKQLPTLISRISFDEDDNEMSSDRWLEVVGLCEMEGMYDVGIDILTAITIGEAVNRAAIAFSMDYIS